MFFYKLANPLGLAALVASACASPVVPAVGLTDLAVARAAAPAVGVDSLESRRVLVDARTVNDKRTEASFDLGHSWNGDVLFDGHYTDGLGNPVGLHVVCKTCYTKGTIGAAIVNAEELQPSLRLDFSSLEAYVDLAVAVTDAATYTVNLFTSNTPLGFGAAGVSGGIIFAVDLVFSLSDAIDISGGGFYVTLPSSAYVESSLADGQISDSFFKGISAKALPITVSNGTATFKCDLRVRTQAGVEGDIAVIGAGLVAGVYINVIELISVIETSDKCGLQAREFLDLNAGAFARAAIDIDYKTFGLAPTVSTTLFSLPTATQCIGSIASEALSVLASATAAAAGAGGSASTTAPFPFKLGAAGGARIGNSTLSFVGPSAATTAATTTTRSGSNTTITATATDVGPVTSTVLTTKTFTITSCKATVVNCPASMQTPITITKIYTNKYTYTNGNSTATGTTTPTAISNVHVLEPCSTPIINTFVPATTTTTNSTTVSASARSAVTTAATGYTPPASGYAVGTGASAGFTASKNGSLSGSYSPTATIVGAAVTGSAAIDKLSGSLAAAAAIFAAAMLV